MKELKSRILAAAAGDLAAIEIALKRNLTPYYDLVARTAEHILFSGGKRLRPLLMVLSARLCGYNGNEDKDYAVIFEYLHAATLLHDDLVDGGEMRRGQTAAHHIYGNATAVLTGDFLLARSLSLAARTRRPAVIDVIAQITESMSQGEIHQMDKKGDVGLNEAEYLEVIRRKTAVLIQGACHVGALICDAAAEQTEALKSYGRHLGFAFQMVDDLLDYTADTQELGKVVGADLREGKLTLPVIHALAKAAGRDREAIIAAVRDPDFSMDRFGALVALLTKYDGLAYTAQSAETHVAAAQRALNDFAPSDAKALMTDIADYALLRKA